MTDTYRTGIVLGLLLVVASIAGSAMSFDAALGLFSGGVDPLIPYSDAGKVQLEGAIAAFETAVGVPADFDYTSESAYTSLWIPMEKRDLVNTLAQCYYVLGDVFSTDAVDARAAFVCGKLWGVKSLRMDLAFAATEKGRGFIAAVERETDVASLCWTCANWGWVDEYDKLTAIGHYDPPKVLALIERALKVDDSYMEGAYRVLAGFWGDSRRFRSSSIGRTCRASFPTSATWSTPPPFVVAPIAVPLHCVTSISRTDEHS